MFDTIDVLLRILVYGLLQILKDLLVSPTFLSRKTAVPDWVARGQVFSTCALAFWSLLELGAVGGESAQDSEGGMIRLETVSIIELKFLNSSSPSCFSYRSWTISFLSSDSSQQYLSQQYPPPPLKDGVEVGRLTRHATDAVRNMLDEADMTPAGAGVTTFTGCCLGALYS